MILEVFSNLNDSVISVVRDLKCRTWRLYSELNFAPGIYFRLRFSLPVAW